jgi:hypothetical protein
MPQPESTQPSGEASVSNKPFGEAACISNKTFGETANVSSQTFTVAESPSVPISCGPPYVSYPVPPAASLAASLASSYEPPQQYQAVDSLAAAVAQGGANQFRIFTSEEKRIDEWKYEFILAAREWFYQHKSSDEAYNKQLMTRIIRGVRQAGARSAVVSYLIKNKTWALVKKGVKWYDVQTNLRWTIY